MLDEPALRILDANNCSTMIIEEIKPGTHLSRPVCSHTRLAIPRSHSCSSLARLPVQVLGQTTAFPTGTPGTTLSEYVLTSTDGRSRVGPDSDSLMRCALRSFARYNLALRQLMEQDQLTSLRNEFIYVDGAPCKSSSVQSDFSKVTWHDVAGLWVILAISVGVGLLVVASYRCWSHWLSKSRAFRKTTQMTEGFSRTIQSMADNNMSGRKSSIGDDDLDRCELGRAEGVGRAESLGRVGRDDDVRDLVMALRGELADLKKVLMK